MPSREKGFVIDDEMENLRLGTRHQYVSDWTAIRDGEDTAFTHNLGEVPWVVDVCYSETGQGNLPKDAASITTVTKTDKTITVQNDIGDDEFVRYFCVRAM